MSSGSREEDEKNLEFVQIGVLEDEFDKCRKQLFKQLRKAHGRIADLDKEVNQKSGIIVDLKREITEQKDNFAKSNASKEEKLRMLSLEVNEKHTKNNELIKENDTLKETCYKEIRYLQNLNVEHKKNIERLNDHIKKMNIDMKNLSSKHRKETEQLEYDLNETKHAFTCKENEIKVRSTELEYQIETLETEKRKLGEIVKTQNTEEKNLKSTQETLELRLETIRAELVRKHKEINWLKKENDTLKETMDKLGSIRAELAKKNKEINWLKKENDTLKETMDKIKGNKFSEESSKPENENPDSAKTSQYMINTNEVLLTEIDQLKLRMEYLVKDRDEQKKAIADFCEKDIQNLTLIFELREELETLKKKNEVLGKVAGANLTYNNPNIADLSEEKRPTQLAEEFSEVYDNEWTDVFEELDFETEEGKTNFMLDILMKTNAICRDLSNDHTKRIKDAFCRLTTSHDTLANAVNRSRIEKKEAKPANFQNEEHFESLNKQIDPNEEEDSQTDEEQTGSTAVEFEKDFGLVTKEEISVQSDFDLLHKNQKKTIVEAKNFFEINLSKEVETTVTDLISKSLQMKMESRDLLETYIKKCVNICWSMCRHNPPLFIEFPDVKENTPFDTNRYKPYTSSGKFIDYIVWPALYLHEDGPCMCKGVAQGRSNKETK